MSTHVASHTRVRPKDHGTKVAPSGLLPSAIHMLLRSKVDGMEAVKIIDGTVAVDLACARRAGETVMPSPIHGNAAVAKVKLTYFSPNEEANR